jgi:YidC/Oxa1 family membrane protein insertase
MEKRTLLAIVLSILIVVAGGVLQYVFFPPTKNAVNNQKETQTTTTTTSEKDSVVKENAIFSIEPQPLDVDEEELTFSNNSFMVNFKTKGAVVSQLKLKEFKEADGSLVDMVLPGNTGQFPFNIILNSQNGIGYDTSDILFEFSKQTPTEWEFKRDFTYIEKDKKIPFTIKKLYEFREDEYLMAFRISIETTDNSNIPLKNYTLTLGPQIGPKYEKLEGPNDYRNLIYYGDGKRAQVKQDSKNPRKKIENRVAWHAIEGKYFVVTGISHVNDLNAMEFGFDSRSIGNRSDVNSLYFDRTLTSETKIDDGYKFYIGPKLSEVLARYNKSDTNKFGQSGLQLDKAVQGSFWDWLSAILKMPLIFFYNISKNWGVAIILLTILIKIIFFPLTHKSTESTKKMQALGPKLEELKVKYKGDPQRLNQEMATLYKKEGVNPLGGCLPLLLQLPIFFALYSLFSDYFVFRGATFIPGWINDLSAPESIFHFPEGWSIPIVGWADIRLLPFLMVGMTYLQQFTAQTPTQSNSQMKIMMYVMPLFFFFIMYNLPSGLLVYWTMQNVFTVLQQIFTNYVKPRFFGKVATNQK